MRAAATWAPYVADHESEARILSAHDLPDHVVLHKPRVETLIA